MQPAAATENGDDDESPADEDAHVQKATASKRRRSKRKRTSSQKEKQEVISVANKFSYKIEVQHKTVYSKHSGVAYAVTNANFSNLCRMDVMQEVLGQDRLPTVLLAVIGMGEIECEVLSMLTSRSFEKVNMVITLSHHYCITEEEIEAQAKQIPKFINDRLIHADPRKFVLLCRIPFVYPQEDVWRSMNVYVDKNFEGREITCEIIEEITSKEYESLVSTLISFNI